MPSTDDLSNPSAVGFLPTLLANLFPIVGVLMFGWDSETLIVLYVLELFFSILFAAVKALFAQRAPQTREDKDNTLISISSDLEAKRGSTEIVGLLPPVYPRNIPFITAVVGFGIQSSLAFGVLLSNIIDITAVISEREVIGSLAILVVTQLIDILRNYFSGEYKTVSPYSVVETPAREIAFIILMLFVSVFTAAAGTEFVVVILISGKIVVEWSGYRAATENGSRLTAWLSGPISQNTESIEVALPEREPDVRVSTDSRATLSTGILHVIVTIAPFFVLPFIIIWIVLLGFVGNDPSSVMAVGITLAVFGSYIGFLLAEVVIFYLRYGFLEYHRYGDRLIAYDRLVEEAQWETSTDVLRGVELVTDRLPDRLLDTRTIVATGGVGEAAAERTIGPVSDPSTLIESFDFPIASTTFEPLNRWPIVLFASCISGILLTVGVLIVAPSVSVGELVVYTGFGLPFAIPLLHKIWAASYPK
jgi:hypothetical protein